MGGLADYARFHAIEQRLASLEAEVVKLREHKEQPETQEKRGPGRPRKEPDAA
jgi:hypothetical protein